jgi:hypothetical protein
MCDKDSLEFGRTIQMFLPSNSPHFRVVEIPTFWTGRVIWASKVSLLENLQDREDAWTCGTYILLGPSPDNPLITKAYIGSSDSVLKRLKNHITDPDKDFWEDTILCLSTDASMTTSHSLLLEKLMIDSARKSKACELLNIQNPQEPAIGQPQRQQTLYYFEQLRLALPTLGVTIFPLTSPIKEAVGGGDVITETIFEIKKEDVFATAREVLGGFVISANSLARKAETDSLQAGYRQLRAKLISSGILVDNDSTTYKFSQDYSFGSSSAAAITVLGASASGPREWRLQGQNKTLFQLSEEQIRASEKAIQD